MEEKEELDRQHDLLHFLQPRVFTTEPIARFLCNWFRVATPGQIDPYKGRIHAHTLMKNVSLCIESIATIPTNTVCPFTNQMLNSPQPREKVMFNGNALECDLQHACVYSIVCRHVAAKQLTGPVAVRLNFYHKGVNKVYKGEKEDEMNESLGGIKGIFLAVTPSNTSEDGNDIENICMAENSCSNAWRTQTMALINERNVENDIIKIPYDVCLQAGMPVANFDIQHPSAFVKKLMEKIQESAAEQGKEPIRSFYAIPYNHVLSWPLRAEEFASQCEFRIWHFQVDNKLMYYLIPQPDYERLLFSFKRSMPDKVDVRPLSSMAFEFVPMNPNIVTRGQIKLRSYINYMVPPLKSDGTPISQQTIDNLATTLAPNVPSPNNWLK